MADISMTVELKAKNGERTQRVIKSTTEDIYKIRKEVRQAGKDMGMTSRQIEGAVKRAVRGVKALKGASGSLKVSGRNLQGRFGTVEQQKMELRVTRANVKTKQRLAQAMRNVLRAAKSRAIQGYTSQISKMRKQMLNAGLSVEQVEKNLQGMHRALRRVRQYNVRRRADVMAGKGMGIEQARMMGAGLVGREKSRVESIVPGVRQNLKQQQKQILTDQQGFVSRYGDTLRMGAMQASGAIGFTLIDIGTKLQNFFSEARVSGQLSGASSNVASAIGGIFGDAVGSIAGDLGKAAGTMAEMFINLATYKLRKLGAIIGGVTKALGYTIASGMIGGILGGLTTGFNPVGILIGGLITAIIFSFIGGLQALTSSVSSVITEIVDIATKSLKVVSSLLTAGFKAIALSFGAVVKGIMRLWKEMWKGITNFAQAAIQKLTSMLQKFASRALQEFMKLEKGATRAAKEVADIYGQMTDRMQSSIALMAGRTGLSVADISISAFNTVSSGFRKVSDQMMIMREASKLALADMTSMGNATKTLTTIFNNFKDQIGSVAEVGRILAASTTLGVATLEEMGPALTFVSPTAKRYNLALKDIAATMSVMTRLFGRGSASRVARYLNRGLEAIFMPRSSGAKELERLGVSVKELFDIANTKGVTQAWGTLLEKLKGVPFDKIRKVFPTIQARRFQIMTDHIDDFHNIMKEMENVDPDVQAKMASNTTARILAKISNILKLTLSRFGMIMSKVAKFIFYNKRMARLWQELAKIMFSERMQVRLNNIAKTIKAVLMPAAYSLYQTFKGVVNAVSKIAFGTFIDVEDIVSMARSVRGIFNEIHKFVERITGDVEVRDYLIMIADMAADVAKGVRNMFRALNMSPEDVMANVSGWWDSIRPELERVSGLMGNYLYNKMNEIFATIGLNFGDLLSNAYDSLLNADFSNERLQRTFEILALSIRMTFSKLWSDILLDLMEKFLTSDNQLVKLVVGAIKEIYGASMVLLAVGKLLVGIFDDFSGVIDDIYTKIWNMFKLMNTLAPDFSPLKEPGAEILEKLHPDKLKSTSTWGGVKDVSGAAIRAEIEALQKGGAFSELHGILMGETEGDKNIRGAIDEMRRQAASDQEKLRQQLNDKLLEAEFNRKSAGKGLSEEAGKAQQKLQDKLAEAQLKRIRLDARHVMKKEFQRKGGIIEKVVPGMVGARPEIVKKFGEGGFAHTKDFSGQNSETIAAIMNRIVGRAYKQQYRWAMREAPRRGESTTELAAERAKMLNMALRLMDVKPKELRGKSPEELERILSNAFERGARKAMQMKEQREANGREIAEQVVGFETAFSVL